MGFMDDVKNVNKKTTIRQVIEQTLDKKDLAEFNAALADVKISAASITKVLRSRNINVSVATIARMRDFSGN